MLYFDFLKQETNFTPACATFSSKHCQIIKFYVKTGKTKEVPAWDKVDPKTKGRLTSRTLRSPGWPRSGSCRRWAHRPWGRPPSPSPPPPPRPPPCWSAAGLPPRCCCCHQGSPRSSCSPWRGNFLNWKKQDWQHSSGWCLSTYATYLFLSFWLMLVLFFKDNYCWNDILLEKMTFYLQNLD